MNTLNDMYMHDLVLKSQMIIYERMRYNEEETLELFPLRMHLMYIITTLLSSFNIDINYMHVFFLNGHHVLKYENYVSAITKNTNQFPSLHMLLLYS